MAAAMTSRYRFFSPISPVARTMVTMAPRRTYPQYTVYGHQCLLSLKIVLPSFRVTQQKAIYVDGSKGMGRVVLEWIPRDANGTSWRDSNAATGESRNELTD